MPNWQICELIGAWARRSPCPHSRRYFGRLWDIWPVWSAAVKAGSARVTGSPAWSSRCPRQWCLAGNQCRRYRRLSRLSLSAAGNTHGRSFCARRCGLGRSAPS